MVLFPLRRNINANFAVHCVCRGGHVFSPAVHLTELWGTCADFLETWWKSAAWGAKNTLNYEVDPNHEVATQIVFQSYRMSTRFNCELAALIVNQEREWHW